MKIQADAKPVALFFLAATVFLTAANIAGLISKFVFDHDRVYGLIPMFDFNGERNLPTLFSCIVFVVCAALLALITAVHRRSARPYWAWAFLAGVFLFLSLDEMASLHETSGGPFSRTLQPTGFFYYAWVIPYGIAVVVFAASYVRFLWRLDKRTRTLFIVSGALFVTGALGFEMLGARHHNVYATQDFVYAAYYTGEELFELLGLTLFIYTLLSYIGRELGGIELAFTERAAAPSAASPELEATLSRPASLAGRR